jgi:hypothetical protein
MKKFIIIFLLLASSASTFSQQTNSKPLLKPDYLKKSKSQKTIAWVLLGSGTAMMITGSIIWNNAYEKRVNSGSWEGLFAPYTTTEGTTLTAAGLVVSAGSIPLFIVARKNKRKAMSLAVQAQKIPQLNKNIFAKQTVPSLTLKIHL